MAFGPLFMDRPKRAARQLLLNDRRQALRVNARTSHKINHQTWSDWVFCNNLKAFFAEINLDWPRSQPRPIRRSTLLQLNFCASLFKLLFGGVSFRLRSSLQHRLGSAFDQGFGFCQA